MRKRNRELLIVAVIWFAYTISGIILNVDLEGIILFLVIDMFFFGTRK